MSSPIQELRALGQSLWLDNIRRQLVTSGELARLRDEGLSGVTSNPWLFDLTVNGGVVTDQVRARGALPGPFSHLRWKAERLHDHVQDPE